MAKSTPTKSFGAVTPNDTTYLSTVGQLYVGTLGDLNVLLEENDDSNDSADGTTYKNVQGNFPRNVKKVFATGTTATDIVLEV